LAEGADTPSSRKEGLETMSIPQNEELRKARQRERRERLRKAASELRAAFCDLYDISTVNTIYLACGWEGDRPYHYIGASHCDNSSGYLLEYDPSTKKRAAS
jgi:hypothetical protein